MQLAKSLLPLAALLLIGLPAEATVMIKLDLDTLVGRADRVVVGKVRSVKSRWADEARKRIVTDAEIVVEETVHGTPSQVVTVRTLGGVVDGIGMRVSGSTRFKVGQRVLAFTEIRGKHRWMVGMRQGLFLVSADASGKRVVHRSVRGLSLMRRTDKGLQAAQPSALDETRPLGSFVEEIRQRVKQCATRADRCLPKRLRGGVR